MTQDSLGPLTEDRLLDGRLRLRQPARGHRAGTDAILLAAAVPDLGEATLVDLGAGVGTVGLAVGIAQPRAALVLVERHPGVAALAAENIDLSGMAGRARLVAADVAAKAADHAAAGLLPGSAARVAMNPPFLEPAGNRPSPSAYRNAAHRDEAGMSVWIGAARRLLAPRGVLCIVHRADALPDLLAGLARGFGGLTVRTVHPRADSAATRILVCARLGSRRPLQLLPPVVLHGPDGRFTPEAEALHRGRLTLPYQ